MPDILKAALRSGTGKTAAKNNRQNGLVPAVIYARGEKTRELTVPDRAFGEVMESIRGKTPIVEVQVGDEAPVKCIIKQLQRHSISLRLMHVDFQKIHANEKVTIQVPIHLTGIPAGIKMGGLLEHTLRELPVRGLPEDLPDSVTMDITGLKLGQSLHVSDVKLEKVEIQLPANTGIASVLAPKKVEEAAPAEAAAAAPVEGEAPKEPEVISEKKTAERAEERAKTESEAKGGKPAKAKEEKKEEKKK